MIEPVSSLPSSPSRIDSFNFQSSSTNSPKRRRSPDPTQEFKSSLAKVTPTKSTSASSSTSSSCSSSSSKTPDILTRSPYTTPPHLPSTSPKSSPESPNLLLRRAATLPNKTLVILQQMRFNENHLIGAGLQIGPGSAGFEGLEGLSPMGLEGLSSIPTGQAGYAFRMALGLEGSKLEGKATTPPFNPQNDLENISTSDSNGALSSSILSSPNFFRSPSSNNRRRLLGLNTSTSNSDLVKIPPSLRGNSRILDTLNLSPQSPNLSSPRLTRRDQTSNAAFESPTSSPVSRSSAFNYFNQPPLTPLTPSHIPGAPILGSSNSGFEWNAYSQLDSPGCPLPPNSRSIFEQGSDISPRQPFFLPSSFSSNHSLSAAGGNDGFNRSTSTVGLFGRGINPGSPLKERSVGNPFF